MALTETALRSPRHSAPPIGRTATTVAEERPSPTWIGWLSIVAVGAFAVVEALRIVVQHPRMTLYGDQALLELGARRAAHFDQLVGPYSRNGFHHPGPAVLYLLAPFVRLFAGSGPGLYLGATVISGAALVAAVAVIWRRLGPLAAAWAASAIAALCLCLGVGTLREPWNPYLVIAPMILFVVLWAAGVTGSSDCAIWAAVAGSFAVQTHIATTPFVVVLCTVLIVRGLGVRYRAQGSSPAGEGRWTAARAIGLIALTAMWAPPIVELWRDRPNNLQLIWDFFTSPHTSAPLGHALHVAADAMTILPFGNHDYVLQLNRSPAAICVAAVLVALMTVASLRLARGGAQPMARALAASGVVGFVVGTASLTRADGPAYLYLAVWLAFVPLTALLALGAAVVGTGPTVTPAAPASRSRLSRTPWLAGCVVVALLATVWADVRTIPIGATTGSGPWPPDMAMTIATKQRTVRNTQALTRAAETVLGPADHRVTFVISSSGVWPYVAGMVLGLDGRGVQSTVAPASWQVYFGHERAPGPPVTIAFSLGFAGTTPAAGAVIANIDGVVLTYTRVSITQSASGPRP